MAPHHAFGQFHDVVDADFATHVDAVVGAQQAGRTRITDRLEHLETPRRWRSQCPRRGQREYNRTPW